MGVPVIRPFGEPGDADWVVAAHGSIYAAEFGWNDSFGGLVAEIVAGYRGGDREAGWMAELDGRPVGCVFCVERDPSSAQLRVLLVDPAARGHGLGARLVDECVSFARAAGYDRIMLWTNSVLESARRIYQAAGFVLVEEDAHRSFGQDLLGQTWTLELD